MMKQVMKQTLCKLTMLSLFMCFCGFIGAEEAAAEKPEVNNSEANKLEANKLEANKLENKKTRAAELEEILSETLSDSEYVETKRCLRTVEYRRIEIMDSGHMLFYGRRGQVWLNQLRHNCPGLRKGLALQFKLRLNRLCDMDFFEGLSSYGDGFSTTALCVLGKFETITKEQVVLLEDSLEQARRNKITKKAREKSKKN